MSRSSALLTVATVAAVGSLVLYALYFDHKRRSDAAFRKQLRKDQKRVIKMKGGQPLGPVLTSKEPADLKVALAQIRQEPIPSSVEEREKYFMEQVAVGEQLSAQGPMFEVAAALAFFRALRVYPAPVELIMIYQNTVPPNIFKIVMDLTNQDVKERAEGYFDVFPPASMNVKVMQVDVPNINTPPTIPMKRNVLVANKDFSAGDVIYKERPIVAALDSDLEGKGTHCTHCLRPLLSSFALRAPEPDPVNASFCSKSCLLQSTAQSHNLLFGFAPLVPPEVPSNGGTKEARLASAEAFANYLKRTGNTAPLLVARFIGRVVSDETAKLVPAELAVPPPPSDLPEPDALQPSAYGSEYTYNDHMERLRHLEIEESPSTEEEVTLLKKILANAMAGLEEFFKDDQKYLTLKGTMLYNGIGVSYSGGRDDKPPSNARPEDVEHTRTPHGTARQTGTAFYRVSSYLTHSCAPSVRPSFRSGNSELHLIANRDIKKGEELTMAYVSVDKKDADGVEEGRRKRRYELARGWGFACICKRCVAEGPEGKKGKEIDEGVKLAEVGVDPAVAKFENKASAS